jgi:hypothetical protein
MWKPAKLMLEALWNSGEIVIAGRVNSRAARRPRDHPLGEVVQPLEPGAGRHDPAAGARAPRRASARRADRGRDRRALAASGRHRADPAPRRCARPIRLVGATAGEDGGADVLVAAGTDLDPPRPGASVLLSPFDNLLWDRAFARRLFDIDHLIEVYKPVHQRQYGYYVLPFLWRDRIVGRADLKSARRGGTLVVKALHLEPRVRRSAALDDAFDRALDRLRRTIGLERAVR